MDGASGSRGNTPHIVVAGAGSVGCFVGGMLARGAHHVTLLLRPRMAEELLRQGLNLTDFQGLDEDLSPDLFALASDPACLEKADVILVTVKSGDTEEMGHLIRRHARKDTIVVSLQNGIGNAGVLKELLPDLDVRAGMVPFSVAAIEGGRFHRGTSGDIVIEKGPNHLARHLSVQGLAFHERKSMTELQWGKLIVNLNNALIALSGLTLKEELNSMVWRRLMSDQIREALRVLEAAGIRAVPPMSTRMPIRFLPKILRLPSPLFNRVARAMLTIDPHARSSMWDDLEMGRRTEVEELQGVIVELGNKEKIKTPINKRVAQLVREVEAKEERSPGLMAHEIRP
ncbi:ketopantoate reductase [Shimia gijangensis]|uniref:2-dehydropantoate 2-reductase n=1 Tax=Shimia gijangensis TaxID=1470563 RepID=A0A1M6IAS3_9RHOB|nr:2-dehydropantoate 2-reductase [Shimia gijangensis]SHJ31534.1 ketopantoate reductase [Shimia gijangensis]